jgi:hypothetical protein
MILRRIASISVVLILLAASAFGDEVHERRATAGLKLFRALLAADIKLPAKTVGPNQILIVFLYVNDRRHAENLANRFIHDAKERDSIRGLSIVTEISNDPMLAAYGDRVPAGVFIAESPSRAALASIIGVGIQRHLIVYSPFEGHVESGVLGGLSVEAQVRPFLNRQTLEASQIALKPFFLNVAKVFRQ